TDRACAGLSLDAGCEDICSPSLPTSAQMSDETFRSPPGGADGRSYQCELRIVAVPSHDAVEGQKEEEPKKAFVRASVRSEGRNERRSRTSKSTTPSP
ncbi:MAG TPA: hypothetical protein VJ349_06415, partial [Stellaceae bacterium]|nr:hypothetical protein [Stellaceae bacterium]